MPRTFWLILFQDVERPVGGVKQIFRLAEALTQLGSDVRIVQGSSTFVPSWFDISTNIKLMSVQDFNSISLSIHRDVLIIPETFIPYYFKLPAVSKIIFNQNAAYTFGEKLNIRPEFVRKVYTDSLLVAVFCVSLADYKFFTNAFHLPPSIVHLLVNPIETDTFTPYFPKEKVISYMPRKNSSHSRIVLSLLRESQAFNDSWSFVPIHKMTLKDVSATLKSSFIFLSFGYPEGFGLPIAEAMACGCFVVGYEGIGGRELFAFSGIYGTSVSLPYMDFSSFVNSTTDFMISYDQVSSSQSNLPRLEVSKGIRNRYSNANFIRSIKGFLDAF